MVEGRAEHAGVEWGFRFPALTCDESPQVAVWMESVADWLDDESAQRVPAELRFIEPNLSFAVVARGSSTNAGVWVQVTLEQEFQEPYGRRPGRRSVLRMSADVDCLRTAAVQWLSDITPFPDLSGRCP